MRRERERAQRRAARDVEQPLGTGRCRASCSSQRSATGGAGRAISSRWQRLRSVGSRRDGRAVTSISTVRGAGSSSVFSSAFCAFVRHRLAPAATIATR